MGRLMITIFLCFTALCATGQTRVSYAYDANGNRVSRAILLSRTMAKSQALALDSVVYDDMVDDVRVKIRPNPDNASINISVVDFDADADYSYSVYSTSGAFVDSGRLTSPDAIINMSDSPAGVYVLKIIREFGIQILVKLIDNTENFCNFVLGNHHSMFL